MTEIELIRAAQAGDRKAKGALYKMHRGFLFTMARKYYIPGHDFEDLLQLAAMGLMDAVRDYDFNSGCKLLTLAFHKIRRQFHLAIIPYLAKKRQAITISLDSPLPDTDSILSDIIPAPIEEPTESDYMPHLMKCVSTIRNQRKRAVFEAIAEQLAIGEIVTLAEVGEMFNLSRERVRQIKEREIKGPAFQRLRGELLQG